MLGIESISSYTYHGCTVEYTPQSHNPSDFDVFFGNYSKSQVGERPTLISIDGGALTPGGDLGESSLDLQYVLGLVGKKQEVLLYQTGDAIESASFNNLLDGLDGSFCTFEGGDDPSQDGLYPDPNPGGYKGAEDCGGKPSAYVISTSYGYQEADLTPAYMQRQCAEYGKLSLTGITFVYSSGDSGVAGFDGSCLTEDGQQVIGASRFNPTFPGGCPYVTSVGATRSFPGTRSRIARARCSSASRQAAAFPTFSRAQASRSPRSPDTLRNSRRRTQPEFSTRLAGRSPTSRQTASTTPSR